MGIVNSYYHTGPFSAMYMITTKDTRSLMHRGFYFEERRPISHTSLRKNLTLFYVSVSKLHNRSFLKTNIILSKVAILHQQVHKWAKFLNSTDCFDPVLTKPGCTS